MPAIRKIFFAAAVPALFGVSACTSTSSNVSTSLALAPEEELVMLPETMTIVPQSSTGYMVAVAAVEPASPDAAGAPIMESAFVAPQNPAISDDPGRNAVDRLISKYAAVYEVPETLVRRVVKRESNFRPSAYNNGHWGLMQIKHATARGMGYQGTARGLLNAETNLQYAVKYLRGAYMVADGDEKRADRLYQTGYYYDAKRKGLLDETGLGTDRRTRLPGA